MSSLSFHSGVVDIFSLQHSTRWTGEHCTVPKRRAHTPSGATLHHTTVRFSFWSGKFNDQSRRRPSQLQQIFDGLLLNGHIVWKRRAFYEGLHCVRLFILCLRWASNLCSYGLGNWHLFHTGTVYYLRALPTKGPVRDLGRRNAFDALRQSN